MAWAPAQLFSYFMAGEAGIRKVVIVGTQAGGDTGGTVEAADFGLTEFYDFNVSHNASAAKEPIITLNTPRTIATVTTAAGDLYEFTVEGPDDGTGVGV